LLFSALENSFDAISGYDRFKFDEAMGKINVGYLATKGEYL